MGHPEKKSDLKRNIESARYLLGKASLSRRKNSSPIFFGYFFVALFGGLLYYYKDFLNNWIIIIILLLAYSVFLAIALLICNKIKKNGMSYVALLIDIRAVIDSLVEMVDWTVYRGKNLDKKTSNSLLDIISSFDKERKAIMSPARNGVNLFRLLVSLQYTLSCILFLLAFFVCLRSVMAKPWMFF